ncbi:MAG: M28 family peptidase [Gemmatimonadetes bacterium]|nr:M28 family peptidase [Gemmatimonadota bacterium]
MRRASLAKPAIHRAVAVVVIGLIGLAGCTSGLAQRFQGHVDYLARDELAGRGVGSPGIELAAEYIARQFAGAGLEPAGDDGTYFQSFPLAVRRSLTDASRLSFTGEPVENRLGRDFIPFHFSSNEEFSGPVIFCGYGIVASARGHDDFGDIDLAGGVAMILRGEPDTWTGEDGRPTRHAMFRSKVYNAKDRGVVAVLIVNSTPEEGEGDELIEFREESSEAYGIPAFHITRSLANRHLASAGLGTLAQLQERLDAGDFVSAALPHVQAKGYAGLETEQAPVRNVIGLLRGRGPLADECVVVGAHYDHLGIRKPMRRKFKAGTLVREDLPPQIHNGADDNASGVGGLIEIARLIASGPPLGRSIVFVAFTAEESGLHGSRYYVEHPAVDLEKTVAMLNLDMIGRMEPKSDRVLVFGARSGTGIEELVERASRRVGLGVTPTTDMGGRSDHASFIRRSIPSMHFFTGIHSDYHQPSDDSDKINAEGGARVTRLVSQVARQLADRTQRPTFEAVIPSRRPSRDVAGETPTYRVVMGIAPGYGEDGQPGMVVEQVSPQGPADLAGMKAGDRIIRIDEKKVANIYDYMAATRNKHADDTVRVVVLRDGREVTLQVMLASAR